MESKFTGSYIQFGNYQLRRTADNGLAFKVKEGCEARHVGAVRG